MIQVWTDEASGIEYIHGTARVLKAPRYTMGKKNAICNFSAEVEAHPTGNKTQTGRTEYANTLYNFVAFRRLAEYCRNLEKGDIFAFYGVRDIDNFWTEKSRTGEVAYRVTLEFCSVQPTDTVTDPNPFEQEGGGDPYGDFYEPPY